MVSLRFCCGSSLCWLPCFSLRTLAAGAALLLRLAELAAPVEAPRLYWKSTAITCRQCTPERLLSRLGPPLLEEH